MKICQLSAVDFGVYHLLSPLMRALRDDGHDVTAISAPGQWVEDIERDGFRHLSIPFKRSYDVAAHVRAYMALVEVFGRERFDVVHVHSPIAALIGRLAAARAGVPSIVYTAHGFYFHENQPVLPKALFIALEWIGGRYTDILFTQSVEDAETARRLGLCGGETVLAIGNGADPERFQPAPPDDAGRSSLRGGLGAGPDDVVILTAGRLVAEKGYPELFEAIRRVNAHLWVAGERLESEHAPGIGDWIERIKQDASLSARVRFLGYRGDMPDLMRAADIFTLPSHREGMPRSIIEAMMSGLPVVATDVRGSREEVVDGETGLLTPVRDVDRLAAALRRLSSSGDERRRMGRAGLERARTEFSEQEVIRRQLAVFHEAGSKA